MTEARAFERIFKLDDISVRADAAGEGGRIIDAYAAVYNREAEINDWEGHFMEVIRPGAFTKTINDNGNRFTVLFNHGKTIFGSPAERFSMPIGTPIEVKEDRKGLRTSTTVANTELGEEVLELVRSGAIHSMSFSGRFTQSKLILRSGTQKLDTIERLEVQLREYGPCVFPSYATAAIIGTRAEDFAAAQHLSEAERQRLVALLQGTEAPAGAAVGTPQASAAIPDTEPPTHSARQQLEASLRRRRLADNIGR